LDPKELLFGSDPPCAGFVVVYAVADLRRASRKRVVITLSAWPGETRRR